MEEAFIYIMAGTVFLFLTSVFFVRPIPIFSYKQLIAIASVILVPTLTIKAFSNCFWPNGFIELSSGFGNFFLQIIIFYNLYLMPFILLLCCSLLASIVLSYLLKRPASHGYDLLISLSISTVIFWFVVGLLTCSLYLSGNMSEQRAPWVLVIQILSAISLYTAVTSFITLLLSKKAFKVNHWKVRKVALGILLLSCVLFFMFEYFADTVTDRPKFEPVPIVNSI